ncbi:MULTISPECIES: sucrose-phosphate phosphatase [unclassified Tolypothrix]|uniref:sucrose-phosphate phosphatase n=1 Tax=unclassified Tolypothrix TaxID=2649714 RepID=UPI0005F7C3FA|nr:MULTISPECIES: sucrose-phosphate phosphatase [unclassified Tolypothrix]MBE9087855.1 sucrose-phosphate phosphatase [Tolypothrix sp. LEGE 11397]UYD23767.1 sucrose-phosphate phosphatase [Tolypothrix sp. PCC 7712]UYD34008.1 sucrose-phosphate phosphatase [Tolypothrix sp. PCC 7601]
MTSFLFVTDLDHTFVGNDEALVELSDRLEQHRQAYGTKIVYATGRSPKLYRELQIEKNLMPPDALVLSVGTEIYLDGSDNPDAGWSEILSQNWERNVVLSVTEKYPELILQPDSEQRPFKVSFFLEQAVAPGILSQLELQLQKHNLQIKLIYSSGIDLDIVPLTSDKGQAMQFLRQKWKFAAEQTVVCGDSGNDIALFAVGNERGIIVGNARPELLQWHNQYPANYRYLAQNFCAGGILEGLKYFGFLE